MTYWINTVSREHVLRAVAGGFTQANHGKPHMLRRMAAGDWIAFYSPRTDYPDGAPLQAFTALGEVLDDAPYRDDAGGSGTEPAAAPWRRRMRFLAVRETPIRPLLPELHFISDPARWGWHFRVGVFAIDQHDFDVLRAALTDPAGDSTLDPADEPATAKAG